MITKQQARKRLLHNVRQNQPVLFLWCIVYTLASVIYPIFGVVMPKVLIQGLISDQASITWVMQVVGVFFSVSAAFTLIMNLRINYAKDQAVRLMTMDYEHTEDAHFFEKYERSFTSVASNSNGIEGVYNAYWEMPALVLTSIVLSYILGRKSILVLAAIIMDYMLKSEYRSFNMNIRQSAEKRVVN